MLVDFIHYPSELRSSLDGSLRLHQQQRMLARLLVGSAMTQHIATYILGDHGGAATNLDFDRKASINSSESKAQEWLTQ